MQTLPRSTSSVTALQVQRHLEQLAANIGTSSVVHSVDDPGTGQAIPVDLSASIALVIGAGAETNTLAAPTFQGQQLSICCKSVGGGTRTITAAAAINVAGNTHMAFSVARHAILLTGVQVGAALVWSVTSKDGTALS